MPYVNIKITKEGATPEQKAQLIQGATQLLVDVLGKNPKTTVVVIEDIEVYLNLNVDSDSELDRGRLEKELAEAESQIQRLEKLLASSFAQKAPEKVVQAEREKLDGYRASAIKIRERLN